MKPQNLTLILDNFDNDAMQNAPEIAAAEILEHIAEHLRSGVICLEQLHEKKLRDLNGNTVGRLLINEPQPQPQPQPAGDLLSAVCNLIFAEDATTREISETEVLPETLRLIHFGQCWQPMRDKAEDLAGRFQPAAIQIERMYSIEKEISGDE